MNKYLSITYYVPGTGPGAGNIAVNETDKDPTLSYGTYILVVLTALRVKSQAFE